MEEFKKTFEDHFWKSFLFSEPLYNKQFITDTTKVQESIFSYYRLPTTSFEKRDILPLWLHDLVHRQKHLDVTNEAQARRFKIGTTLNIFAVFFSVLHFQDVYLVNEF